MCRVIDKYNPCQHAIVLSRVPKGTWGITKGSIGELPENKRTVANGPVIMDHASLRVTTGEQAEGQDSIFTFHELQNVNDVGLGFFKA